MDRKAPSCGCVARGARSRALGFGLAGAAALAGCTDYGPLDRDMRDLMQERTSLVGANVVPDYRPPLTAAGLDDPALVQKTPATVNPKAGELSYKIADESRDVAS